LVVLSGYLAAENRQYQNNEQYEKFSTSTASEISSTYKSTTYLQRTTLIP
jgi:hypothetical protein